LLRASEGAPEPTFDPGFLRRLVWAVGITPACLLGWDALRHSLGVNGVNYAIRTTGMLALVFLVLALVVTPARKLTGLGMLIAVRRSLGLFSFFYLAVHFSLFYGLDRAASLGSTVHEIVMRRYLQIGTLALVLMIPLAATSMNAMVKRLGARRWKKLHRLTYLIAALACVHYVLLVKADVRQPLAFGAVVSVLLGYRALTGVRARRKGRGIAAQALVSLRRARPWSGELRIVRTTMETRDVRTVRLAEPSGKSLPFVFAPGQYLNVTFRIGDKTVRRSYTIASSAGQKDWCEITVKRVEGGLVSRHVHEALADGQTVAISAPAGHFVFDTEADGAASSVTLIGGGVGITPLMSIVRSAADRGWRGRIDVVLSMRAEDEIIFRDELEELARRWGNLRVTVTITREAASTWKGRRGKLTKETLAEVLAERTSGPVYLCGPDPMMRDVRVALRSLGVDEDAIRTEEFVSPTDASSAPAAEIGDLERVHELTFEREDVVVAAPRRLTLLEAAEDAGVDLPFECRSGICGQCKVRVLEGEVRMDAEDALSRSERLEGVVLACQAHAVTDVIVDA
jgi:ferredoxin-NADP reductase/DMSO/TMAO reductase YedYZ heme-binding membrane subunit